MNVSCYASHQSGNAVFFASDTPHSCHRTGAYGAFYGPFRSPAPTGRTNKALGMHEKARLSPEGAIEPRLVWPLLQGSGDWPFSYSEDSPAPRPSTRNKIIPLKFRLFSGGWPRCRPARCRAGAQRSRAQAWARVSARWPISSAPSGL